MQIQPSCSQLSLSRPCTYRVVRSVRLLQFESRPTDFVRAPDFFRRLPSRRATLPETAQRYKRHALVIMPVGRYPPRISPSRGNATRLTPQWGFGRGSGGCRDMQVAHATPTVSATAADHWPFLHVTRGMRGTGCPRRRLRAGAGLRRGARAGFASERRAGRPPVVTCSRDLVTCWRTRSRSCAPPRKSADRRPAGPSRWP